MNKKEGQQNNGTDGVVEIVALYMERRIKKEDMSPENQAILEFYLGIIPDDPKFAAAVEARRKQFSPQQFEGRRTSLFPQEVIARMSKRKTAEKRENMGFQPNLWPENEVPKNQENEFESRIDSLDRVMEVGKNLNSRFGKNEKFFAEEIKDKKEALRNEIGLPIARGKSPHVKDSFYKFLVKNICHHDRFGIFGENNATMLERSEELETKIEEVKGMVEEVLGNKNLRRQERFRRLNQFFEEYKNKWENNS